MGDKENLHEINYTPMINLIVIDLWLFSIVKKLLLHLRRNEKVCAFSVIIYPWRLYIQGLLTP